jgi:hypothetical protein
MKAPNVILGFLRPAGMDFLARFLRLRAASASGRGMIVPPGIVPDNAGMWGLWGAVQNLEQVDAIGFNTVASATSTAVTATAAGVAGGILNRTGSPGSGVTETTPTAAQIIAALPNTIPLDGTYQFKFRYINNAMGQTVTWTAGSGVTVTGTATIATSAWREFMLTVDSATAVTFTNIGGGSL